MLSQLLTLEIWNLSFLGNTLGEYVLALGVLIGFVVVFKIFQSIIVLRLRALAERTKTDIDDTLIEVIQSLNPPFYIFLAFYFVGFPYYFSR